MIQGSSDLSRPINLRRIEFNAMVAGKANGEVMGFKWKMDRLELFKIRVLFFSLATIDSQQNEENIIVGPTQYLVSLDDSLG